MNGSTVISIILREGKGGKAGKSMLIKPVYIIVQIRKVIIVSMIKKECFLIHLISSYIFMDYLSAPFKSHEMYFIAKLIQCIS